MIKKIILIALSLMILCACQPQTVIVEIPVKDGTPIPTPKSKIDTDYIGGGLYRVVDRESGIVCYTDKTVVCFDIDDTWLSKE